MKPENILMQRAVQLAGLARAATKTNPAVAAIVYHNNGMILGEGYHQMFGGHHAEVNAIHTYVKGHSSRGKAVNLLVTLEPCNHRGKTPPCVDLILKNTSITKVLVGNVDPNPRMSGNSLKILKESGVVIERSDLEAESEKLLQTFKVNIGEKRPYVYLKIAMDKTGTTGDRDRRLFITDPVSQFYNHRIRSEVNALLIGKNTAQLDDPLLSNRLAGGDSPLRVVIDLGASLPADLQIFTDKMPTLYVSHFTRTDLEPATEIFKTALEDKDLLLQLLHYLYEAKNTGSILIEGGAETINRFIKYNLWDELIVFQSKNTIQTDSPVKFTIPPARLVSDFKLKADNLYFYKPINKC